MKRPIIRRDGAIIRLDGRAYADVRTGATAIDNLDFDRAADVDRACREAIEVRQRELADGEGQ